MTKPDVSQYFEDTALALREEKGWLDNNFYKRNVSMINELASRERIDSVLELCCGSGFVPALLPKTIKYLGIDANSHFIRWAKEKNTLDREFIQADIRTITPEKLYARGNDPFSVVCMFAAFKHFSLDEFEPMIIHVLQFASIALFDMQIRDEDLEEDLEYPHIFVTLDRLHKAVDKAGHRVAHVTVQGTFNDSRGPFKDLFFETHLNTEL